MNDAAVCDSLVTMAPTCRLQWEDTRQFHVLLYPQGSVTLDRKASCILRQCDGTKTVRAIISELRTLLPDEVIERDVTSFLENARAKGWVLFS